MDPQPVVDMFSDDNEAEKAERTSLLNELDGLVDSALFSRGLWACLRVADLGPLRRIVEDTRHNPVTLPGLAYSLRQSNLLKYCKSSLGCRERDGNRCVITKSGEPIEVAHIFPFAMRGLQTEEARLQFYSPWKILKFFWSEEKVERWLNAIQATTETPKNLFCLAPHVHAYQGKAYFSLKHLGTSEDHTSCTVMFVWLPDFDTPKSLRLCLWDVTTRLPISTGSRIVLETTDPVRLPLPDADLLELHWVLQRVAAMAGNAEPRDDKYDTDDEDDEMFGVWADDGSDLTFPCHKNRPLR
ncbi:hypothetical protein H109_02503 [Trichophyton interdigitale MR816]|uniref:HNH nuclease domain-containing protein n=1 Tax=Trichophyton interdigitale (strain MR816) TaxID=1215338 RepID=A0A059JCU3_TRIIM|nr:hypothetical protein H101_03792 [Trichophyton interdigitale H6]KDB25671.1 hypothetical protein H109_02503 [Trichophyton interdigitale MR816]